MCLNCSLQTSIFFDVEHDGTSHWCESNGPPPDHLERYEEDLHLQTLTLGKQRKTPYIDGGAHVGWVSSLGPVSCVSSMPDLQQTMCFVGQLEPATDLGAPSFLEGVIYAFLCLSCGKATAEYQQT